MARAVIGTFAQVARLSPPEASVSDVIGAAEYLNKQPYVAKNQIGVIGFSHGGWTIMRMVQGRYFAKEYGIKGAVAFYPLCDERRDGDVALPLQVIIGEKDDWTPAERCRQLQVSRNLKRPDLVEFAILPNAYHSFDRVGLRPTTIAGTSVGGAVGQHHLEHNPDATAEAEQRVKTFFNALLRH